MGKDYKPQNDLYYIKSPDNIDFDKQSNSSNKKPISEYSINKPPVYSRLTP